MVAEKEKKDLEVSAYHTYQVSQGLKHKQIHNISRIMFLKLTFKQKFGILFGCGTTVTFFCSFFRIANQLSCRRRKKKRLTAKMQISLCNIFTSFSRQQRRLLLSQPDRPFRNFGASKYVVPYFWTSYSSPISLSWVSRIGKGPVGSLFLGRRRKNGEREQHCFPLFFFFRTRLLLASFAWTVFMHGTVKRLEEQLLQQQH